MWYNKSYKWAVKDTVPSTTIYLHGTSYKLKHTDTQQESIIYFVIYFYFCVLFQALFVSLWTDKCR
jgi:hypothetical protein